MLLKKKTRNRFVCYLNNNKMIYFNNQEKYTTQEGRCSGIIVAEGVCTFFCCSFLLFRSNKYKYGIYLLRKTLKFDAKWHKGIGNMLLDGKKY